MLNRLFEKKLVNWNRSVDIQHINKCERKKNIELHPGKGDRLEHIIKCVNQQSEKMSYYFFAIN